MNLLLDTHIWLWSLLEPERPAPAVAAALTADTARRWLSPLSVWEAHLLIERTRLRADESAADWIREALAQVFNQTLVNADRALYGIPGVRVLKNTTRRREPTT